VSAEGLFSLASALVLPGWAGYLAIVVTRFFGAEGGFGSLADVRRLFDEPYLLLAGWIHYLAFDLFIGGWELRDARRLALPHLLVVPCLVLTFLFGPVGLLTYWALRAGLRGRVIATE
jgi:ABA DEFICIENT 4-like